MSRKHFENMMEEIEYINYRRWFLTHGNPSFYGMPPLHFDIRHGMHLSKFDFSLRENNFPPYCVFPNFSLSNYEPLFLAKRNEFRRDIKYQAMENNNQRRFFNGKRNDDNIKFDRFRNEEVSHAQRRYFSNWNRNVSQQRFRINRNNSTHFIRNESSLPNEDTRVEECCTKDDHAKSFEYERIETADCLSENNDGIENEFPFACQPRSSSPLKVQHFEKNHQSTNNDRNENLEKISSSPETQISTVSSPMPDSNGYDTWFCPEEQQQIVDLLRDVHVKHERQLKRNIMAASGEVSCSDESPSSTTEPHESPHAAFSSEDEDDGITVLVSPETVPPLPDLNDPEISNNTSNDLLEMSTSDYFQEFQSIFTASPERKIINALTKECLRAKEHDNSQEYQSNIVDGSETGNSINYEKNNNVAEQIFHESEDEDKIKMENFEIKPPFDMNFILHVSQKNNSAENISAKATFNNDTKIEETHIKNTHEETHISSEINDESASNIEFIFTQRNELASKTSFPTSASISEEKSNGNPIKISVSSLNNDSSGGLARDENNIFYNNKSTIKNMIETLNVQLPPNSVQSKGEQNILMNNFHASKAIDIKCDKKFENQSMNLPCQDLETNANLNQSVQHPFKFDSGLSKEDISNNVNKMTKYFRIANESNNYAKNHYDMNRKKTHFLLKNKQNECIVNDSSIHYQNEILNFSQNRNISQFFTRKSDTSLVNTDYSNTKGHPKPQMSLSESFLPPSNHNTYYRRISVDELFRPINQNETNLVGRHESESPEKYVSPSDHLKSILGISPPTKTDQGNANNFKLEEGFLTEIKETRKLSPQESSVLFSCFAGFHQDKGTSQSSNSVISYQDKENSICSLSSNIFPRSLDEKPTIIEKFNLDQTKSNKNFSREFDSENSQKISSKFKNSKCNIKDNSSYVVGESFSESINDAEAKSIFKQPSFRNGKGNESLSKPNVTLNSDENKVYQKINTGEHLKKSKEIGKSPLLSKSISESFSGSVKDQNNLRSISAKEKFNLLEIVKEYTKPTNLKTNDTFERKTPPENIKSDCMTLAKSELIKSYSVKNIDQGTSTKFSLENNYLKKKESISKFKLQEKFSTPFKFQNNYEYYDDEIKKKVRAKRKSKATPKRRRSRKNYLVGSILNTSKNLVKADNESTKEINQIRRDKHNLSRKKKSSNYWNSEWHYKNYAPTLEKGKISSNNYQIDNSNVNKVNIQNLNQDSLLMVGEHSSTEIQPGNHLSSSENYSKASGNKFKTINGDTLEKYNSKIRTRFDSKKDFSTKYESSHSSKWNNISEKQYSISFDSRHNSKYSSISLQDSILVVKGKMNNNSEPLFSTTSDISIPNRHLIQPHVPYKKNVSSTGRKNCKYMPLNSTSNNKLLTKHKNTLSQLPVVLCTDILKGGHFTKSIYAYNAGKQKYEEVKINDFKLPRTEGSLKEINVTSESKCKEFDPNKSSKAETNLNAARPLLIGTYSNFNKGSCANVILKDYRKAKIKLTDMITARNLLKNS